MHSIEDSERAFIAEQIKGICIEVDGLQAQITSIRSRLDSIVLGLQGPMVATVAKTCLQLANELPAANDAHGNTATVAAAGFAHLQDEPGLADIASSEFKHDDVSTTDSAACSDDQNTPLLRANDEANELAAEADLIGDDLIEQDGAGNHVLADNVTETEVSTGGDLDLEWALITEGAEASPGESDAIIAAHCASEPEADMDPIDQLIEPATGARDELAEPVTAREAAVADHAAEDGDDAFEFTANTDQDAVFEGLSAGLDNSDTTDPDLTLSVYAGADVGTGESDDGDANDFSCSQSNREPIAEEPNEQDFAGDAADAQSLADAGDTAFAALETDDDLWTLLSSADAFGENTDVDEGDGSDAEPLSAGSSIPNAPFCDPHTDSQIAIPEGGEIHAAAQSWTFEDETALDTASKSPDGEGEASKGLTRDDDAGEAGAGDSVAAVAPTVGSGLQTDSKLTIGGARFGTGMIATLIGSAGLAVAGSVALLEPALVTRYLNALNALIG